jgi:rhodanese-related sulfurtransferase
MQNTQSLINEICPTSTQSWVRKGALIVDVRENNETRNLMFDVPKILNIPLSHFEERYIELSKNQEMVIVCNDGIKSLLATNFLINNGYDSSKVVHMKHGLIRWVQKGFPTIGDTSSILDSEISNSCCASSSRETSKNSCCH